jgi:hypothetical protein
MRRADDGRTPAQRSGGCKGISPYGEVGAVVGVPAGGEGITRATAASEGGPSLHAAHGS